MNSNMKQGSSRLSTRLADRRPMVKFRSLLALLKEKDSEAFFCEPVDQDEHGAPGYHRVIQEPMDFGTIAAMLDDSNEPMSHIIFDRLVRLVFTNAFTYNNSPTHEVHQAARRLLGYYEQEWIRLKKGSSQDASIDLKNVSYLQTIAEAAERVQTNSSSLNDESMLTFSNLKSSKSAGGDWVTSVRNGKKSRTNDEGAQQKIYSDIETYVKVKRKKSTSSKMKARARSNYQEQGDSGSEGAAKKEVFISLFNQPYREVIIEAAERVCANESSVASSGNSVYSHLKSALGGGVWTKRARGVKVVTDDADARRKIEKDIKDVIHRQGESLKEELKKIPKSKKRKAASMEHDQDDSSQKRKAASIKPSSFLRSQASSSKSRPSKQKKSPHAHVKQEEEEDDESVEAIAIVDLLDDTDSEEESTKAVAVVAAANPRPKAVHVALLSTAGKVVQAPCLKPAQQTPGRPPFFQLYESVMANLSQAEEDGDINAQEFYSQLKEWFVLQTNDVGFSHSSFDHTALRNLMEYFESIIANVTTARSQGNGANLAVYSAELKCHMHACKIRYPVAQTGPIKTEDDETDCPIKHEDDSRDAWC